MESDIQLRLQPLETFLLIGLERFKGGVGFEFQILLGGGGVVLDTGSIPIKL